MAYLIRIKYPLSGFNYNLSHVNVANFNKIHRTVSEQQLFKNGTQKQKFPIWKIPISRKRQVSAERLLRKAYSVHFLKICYGLGRRVDTWNYRTDVY